LQRCTRPKAPQRISGRGFSSPHRGGGKIDPTPRDMKPLKRVCSRSETETGAVWRDAKPCATPCLKARCKFVISLQKFYGRFRRLEMQTVQTQNRPGKLWIGTIPHHQFTPFLPPGVSYTKGQLELGEGGFLHWQLFVNLTKPQRLSWLQKTFGTSVHFELTRSEAAESYVWKEETRIEGTQFELGAKPLRRNDSKDWEKIRTDAIAGRLMDIPADVYVRSYQVNLWKYILLNF